MATNKFLACLVALVAFQSVMGRCSRPSSDPPGCNVPTNLAPVRLSQVMGTWYLQAYVNINNPVSGRCIKFENFFLNSRFRGFSVVSTLTSNNTYENDPYVFNSVRPGVISFQTLRDRTLIVRDYYLSPFNETGYIAHHCFIRNGTTVDQNYAYVSQSRSVPRQTVLNAFRAAGVTVQNSYFVPQTNCRN